MAILLYLTLATLIFQASGLAIRRDQQCSVSTNDSTQIFPENACPIEPFAVVTQQPTTREMWFLSQADGVGLDQTGAFTYDVSAGGESLVYVIDSGAVLSHPVSYTLSSVPLLVKYALFLPKR